MPPKNDVQVTSWIPRDLKEALDKGCINISKALRRGLELQIEKGLISIRAWPKSNPP